MQRCVIAYLWSCLPVSSALVLAKARLAHTQQATAKTTAVEHTGVLKQAEIVFLGSGSSMGTPIPACIMMPKPVQGQPLSPEQERVCD
jgi:hypothetical protein